MYIRVPDNGTFVKELAANLIRLGYACYFHAEQLLYSSKCNRLYKKETKRTVYALFIRDVIEYFRSVIDKPF